MRWLVAAIAAVLLWLLLSFLVRRSVYFPFSSGDWDAGPRLGASDVQLRSSDGVNLHAWWRPLEGARRATLFLHGNAGNVTHRGDVLVELPAAGSAVLLLDYRGYGKSEGSPSEDGLVRDAEAGYHWLRAQGWPPESIVLHGESLGTVFAVELAARLPCGGVILEAPFSSARDVAARILPLLGPLLISGYDSAARIGRVRAPLLFIHGDRDEVIAYPLGHKLFEAAPEPKQFWTVPGAGHNDLRPVAGAQYRRRLAAFYASLAR